MQNKLIKIYKLFTAWNFSLLWISGGGRWRESISNDQEFPFPTDTNLICVLALCEIIWSNVFTGILNCWEELKIIFEI